MTDRERIRESLIKMFYARGGVDISTPENQKILNEYTDRLTAMVKTRGSEDKNGSHN